MAQVVSSQASALDMVLLELETLKQSNKDMAERLAALENKLGARPDLIERTTERTQHMLVSPTSGVRTSMKPAELGNGEATERHRAGLTRSLIDETEESDRLRQAFRPGSSAGTLPDSVEWNKSRVTVDEADEDWRKVSRLSKYDPNALEYRGHKYSGEDKSPASLIHWVSAVRIYLHRAGISEDSVDAFTHITSFTRGKAKDYLNDCGLPEVTIQMHDPSMRGRTTWTLDYVYRSFEARFVRKTSRMDAEYTFKQIRQWDGTTWTDAATLAEDIWSYKDKLVELTAFKAKSRYLDALHFKIAVEVAQTLDISDPTVGFTDVKSAAVDAERGYMFERRASLVRRKGRKPCLLPHRHESRCIDGVSKEIEDSPAATQVHHGTFSER